jgi:hypothetical protein
MADAPKTNGNGNGRPAAPLPQPPKVEIDKQGQDNAARQQANAAVNEAEQKKADPLMPREDMNVGQVMAASPNHMILPDPLPALNRPIFEAPRMGSGHPTLPLHPNQANPIVEAAIEELRVRLGEMREFLKRFPHHVGGDLGRLVHHLRVELNAPVQNHARAESRNHQDRAIAERRRQEDAANNGAVSAATLARRAEEDAGLAVYRRIEDTPA